MNELIKITEYNGKQAVNARELHSFLGSKREFATWIKDRIKKYGLVENQDYIVFDEFVNNPFGGRPLIEYALSINAAKELSMVEGNAKGKQARQYFIACENKLKQIAKPLSPAEQLLYQAQLMVEQEKRMTAIESDVKQIKAQVTTRPNYFTIAGYGTLIGVYCGTQLASRLGRMASKICKERGIIMEKTHDPRFGEVNTYPEIILEEVFDYPIY